MAERGVDKPEPAESETPQPRVGPGGTPESGMDAVIDDVEERTTAMLGRLKERLPHKRRDGEN